MHRHFGKRPAIESCLHAIIDHAILVSASPDGSFQEGRAFPLLCGLTTFVCRTALLPLSCGCIAPETTPVHIAYPGLRAGRQFWAGAGPSQGAMLPAWQIQP